MLAEGTTGRQSSGFSWSLKGMGEQQTNGGECGEDGGATEEKSTAVAAVVVVRFLQVIEGEDAGVDCFVS
jgi:hypothetical protein